MGKDALVSFEASLYSVPARRIRPGQRVELRVGSDLVAIHAPADGSATGELLAVHPRALTRGSWVVDPAHWDGLPDGHTRATVVQTTGPDAVARPGALAEPNPLETLLAHRRAAATPVARRPLADYQAAAVAAATVQAVGS